MEINDELTSDLWEEVLDKGYNFRFKAFGVSMLPLIRSGDILILNLWNMWIYQLGILYYMKIIVNHLCIVLLR